MFDRFTERARKVIILAKEEAKRFNHDYIGTEHILLGLIKEGGLDPLILTHQINFIFQVEPPSEPFLGKTNWQDLQLFFKKLEKECLELIRP